MWKLLKLCIFLFFLIPVVSWVSWKFKKEIPINVLVIDKTTPDERFSEHLSFFWLINQNKWVKRNGDEYDYANDFLGFYPNNDGTYSIKDLKKLAPKDIAEMADTLDLAFFADTYGIYNSNWKDHPDYGKDTISFVYGGMTSEELELMRELKKRKKALIVEFNLFASPTSAHIRKQTEELFGLKWSGWVGRYFTTLDTLIDTEIPKWVPELYRKNYNKEYDFKKAGIVLVDSKEHIIILENETHLIDEFPILKSTQSTQEEYQVPGEIYYPFWFDINTSDSRNEILANFQINVNEKGKQLMDSLNVPLEFPAIFQHKKDYHFTYFACDFSDNQMGIYSSYFDGVEKINGAFYSANQVKDRKMFFWKYYRPFMTTLMDSIHSGNK
nr:hypothetical protein [uncultured Marinifilum sp.]